MSAVAMVLLARIHLRLRCAREALGAAPYIAAKLVPLRHSNGDFCW